jgi:hypothetical protein
MPNGQKEDMDIANQAFYCNALSINTGGSDFIIDFQRTSPRFAIGSFQKAYTVYEHQTILMNAILFKEVIRIGTELLKKFEEKFGEITTPDYVKKINEERQRTVEEFEHKRRDDPLGYFG